ncbi:hypothetical protein IMG5_024160, partial [Ichthyophthirius multifiliis]
MKILQFLIGMIHYFVLQHFNNKSSRIQHFNNKNILHLQIKLCCKFLKKRIVMELYIQLRMLLKDGLNQAVEFFYLMCIIFLKKIKLKQYLHEQNLKKYTRINLIYGKQKHLNIYIDIMIS